MISNKNILTRKCKYLDLGIMETEALSAMKEAQIEVLKELRNRKYDGRPIGVQGKTTDEIIEDLINEIES